MTAVVSALVCLLGEPTRQPVGFAPGGHFGERIRWTKTGEGVRMFVDLPAKLERPRRRLVVFATPNGNTIEQTLGCAAAKGLDWHFDIQHVAAQVRQYRELDSEEDVILAVIEAPKLSWPTFRREVGKADRRIGEIVDELATELHADRITLSGHSGGGSFLFGCINSGEAINSKVDRIVFLDANYGYADAEKHGEKLCAWLKRGDARLVVVAYDDREILLSGKKVVGPTGGTFRATERMTKRFQKDVPLADATFGPFRWMSGLDGRLQFFVHPNPQNKILHTTLVGEFNGLIHGLALGTTFEKKWGTFGGPRICSRWVQPMPFVEPTLQAAEVVKEGPPVSLSLPPRPANALTGSQFRDRIATLPREQREAAVQKEILAGNIPDFLRKLIPIRCRMRSGGADVFAVYHVMADYLAVGTDADFFRMPMTPKTACAIADAGRCTLITPKISDDVFAAAQVRLDPRPLTKERDAAATFFQHHLIIEEQRAGRMLGQLVAGIKKDVVVTNRLSSKPHKVAIYGWHYSNGRPIQPLYVGHVDWYVDYSHGVRLVADQMNVDGKATTVGAVLKDPRFNALLSSEGPIDVQAVRAAAAW